MLAVFELLSDPAQGSVPLLSSPCGVGAAVIGIMGTGDSAVIRMEVTSTIVQDMPSVMAMFQIRTFPDRPPLTRFKRNNIDDL